MWTTFSGTWAFTTPKDKTRYQLFVLIVVIAIIEVIVIVCVSDPTQHQHGECLAAKTRVHCSQIDTLEDYREDLRDGWVRYLAAEYSGGKAPVATACKSRGKKVVGDSDEEQ